MGLRAQYSCGGNTARILAADIKNFTQLLAKLTVLDTIKDIRQYRSESQETG